VAAVMIVIAITVLVLAEIGDGGDAEPGTGLVLGGPTAEEAYSAAAELAEEQWPDAELAIVSGEWKEVGHSAWTGTHWSFNFFSPSAQRLILVLVSGNDAWVVRDALSPYQVDTFSRRDWKVSAEEAVRIWWDEVGKVFVEQRPDADVVAELRVSPDYGGQLVWLVEGLASGREYPLMSVVSAVDGALVAYD
jgi:hypothetical protein